MIWLISAGRAAVVGVTYSMPSRLLFHATAMPPFSVVAGAPESRRRSLRRLACALAISQSQQSERAREGGVGEAVFV